MRWIAGLGKERASVEARSVLSSLGDKGTPPLDRTMSY
jgi:hypothetical protein